MEQQDSPTLPTWNWKLRAAKAMEMGVKKDRRLWIPDRDDRQVRCECSSDREELYMVLLSPRQRVSLMLTSHYLASMRLL